MSRPILNIGMAYSGEYFGLAMTLAALRQQIFVAGLDDDVSITVVNNAVDRTAADIRKHVEGLEATYIEMPTPHGTGPARDRLFREPGAPWQAVIDDHTEFLPGDVAWLVNFVRGNPSDDLYHGVMLRSVVGRRGVPALLWTHHVPGWDHDGLFGKPAINPAAADPDCAPFRIPLGRLAFFLARRESWLGIPAEQRGFGCEGYLPLAYQQAGRSVWCLPHVRQTHVFRQPSMPAKRPNRWEDRANNYLLFWETLAKNPLLTYAGIKQTHVQPGRLTEPQWQQIIAARGIDETAALAGDPPLLSAPPSRSASASQANDPTAWQDCQHRGDVVTTRKADLCGVPKGDYPVYACALHGECVLTRFCKRQPERTCFTCPDAVAKEPHSRARTPSDVAVVIPCHNYGRFLGEAIESVLGQTSPPAEILVVDDASTDETAAVAQQFADRGVRYERVAVRSVYLARRRGLELTTAPFVVFLDADDLLGENYLERGRQCFADPRVALAWTDLQEFGDTTGLRRYAPGDIEAANYIHAGAMVRRVALEQAGAFTATRPVLGITADWFTWREVRRAGWTDRKFEARYLYRQHGAGLHLSGRGVPYFEEAHLAHETVPIVLPLAGRERWWDQLTGWVARQTWPSIELIVIDSSGQPEFRCRAREWLATWECATAYIPLAGTPGLADADRTNRRHYRAVQRMMPLIYRHLARTTREFNLVVEDDVLPPDDAIERLLRGMTSRAACVSGVVRSRYQNAVIAWDDQAVRSLTRSRHGVETIYGTGFGCLLFRRSVFAQLVLNHGGGGNFDHEASHDVARLGRDWRIDWGVPCVHAGLPAETRSPHPAA